ncbi:hypothetical protein CH380_01930 [Leptospira adleri]|uniref:Uncharacterized protein n=1 Tax=Leptospira adleri TaxID=2023186 RepID=A0A2M9YUX2_9LEPT|nr:hypothetical protein CH380_01930 [Leptospira adleri]PJZ62448.1 hypothetical protein CH376_08095 [Leptospira adleri]
MKFRFRLSSFVRRYRSSRIEFRILFSKSNVFVFKKEKLSEPVFLFRRPKPIFPFSERSGCKNLSGFGIGSGSYLDFQKKKNNSLLNFQNSILLEWNRLGFQVLFSFFGRDRIDKDQELKKEESVSKTLNSNVEILNVFSVDFIKFRLGNFLFLFFRPSLRKNSYFLSNCVLLSFSFYVKFWSESDRISFSYPNK